MYTYIYIYIYTYIYYYLRRVHGGRRGAPARQRPRSPGSVVRYSSGIYKPN